MSPDLILDTSSVNEGVTAKFIGLPMFGRSSCAVIPVSKECVVR